MKLRNGTRLTVDIGDLTPRGEGVARAEERDIIVPGGVQGDRIEIAVAHVSPHGRNVWAKPLRFLSRGSGYTAHFCPMSVAAKGGCGGCAIGHLSATEQDAFKLRQVERALQRAAPAAEISFFGAADRTAYRNRSNYIPLRDRWGRVKMGSFRPGTHEPADMAGCAIVRPPIDAVAQKIAALIGSEVPLHPAPTGLRTVTIRADGNGRVLVDLVCGVANPPWRDPLVAAIAALPEVLGISATLNNRSGNAIRVADSTVLAGEETVVETVGPLSLHVCASGFFQLNTATATAMYARASRWCPQAGIVMDLYCGVGGLGLSLVHGSRGRLFGADSAAAAIRLAQRNGADAGADARFAIRDLSAGVPPDWPAPELISVNPPRKGLDVAIRQFLCNRADRSNVIYMSCHPETFAEDAQALCRAGFHLREVVAFDMLPHTPHVELLGFFKGHPR